MIKLLSWSIHHWCVYIDFHANGYVLRISVYTERLCIHCRTSQMSFARVEADIEDHSTYKKRSRDGRPYRRPRMQRRLGTSEGGGGSGIRSPLPGWHPGRGLDRDCGVGDP
jgi:hypothetical protein